MINAIIACTPEFGIGYENNLPWPKNKEDLAFFKSMTLDSVVVMGRNTWDSLGKKLPNRYNVVISSQQLTGPDLTVLSPKSPNDVIAQLPKDKPIWIIGGAKIYNFFKPVTTRIFVTNIEGSYRCDTFLPMDFFDGYTAFNYPHQQLSITEWKR